MMEDKRSLPLALVTGAARRLGAALAVDLARQGFAIGLHYHRSEDDVQALAASIRDSGGQVFLLKADLTHAEEIDRLFESLDDLPNQMQVLVNSAAVMQPGRLDELSCEDWDQVMALNLRAPFLCTQRAVTMMKPGKGLVVNINDTGWDKTWTGYSAYIVSKAGLESLTRLQARTYAPGIRVNAIAPGLILPSADMPEKTWWNLTQKTPLQRPGTLDEVCQALRFLLGNTFVTGQTIHIDGGYRLVG